MSQRGTKLTDDTSKVRDSIQKRADESGKKVDEFVKKEQEKVKKLREYTLTPGAAHVYNEGDVHAPSRAGPTRLIRIEGTNLEGVARGKYEPV